MLGISIHIVVLSSELIWNNIGYLVLKFQRKYKTFRKSSSEISSIYDYDVFGV